MASPSALSPGRRSTTGKYSIPRGLRLAHSSPTMYTPRDIVASIPVGSGYGCMEGPGAPLSRRTLPTRVLVGTVIIAAMFAGLLVFTVVLIFVFLRRRRHRARQQRTAKSRTENFELRTISPFTPVNPSADGPAADNAEGENAANLQMGISLPPEDPGPENRELRSSSANTLRRQYLETELRSVQEKMLDLEDLERRSSAATQRSRSVAHRIMRFVSIGGNATTGSGSASAQDLVSQLEAARERNEVLAARIRQLEEELHSPWEPGLADEPPPRYTA
ncbi:hypothetical protein DFH07DRAFT_858578 [Mycena maculata]|uniref:receptor protein-tyrosine kinase n=1 Tax=Mycena maculata TaxID=230809 RepID=A0AAD7MJR1_9AGAR|nr:hypothetical protein DFH07DRAFT_858578 [Mycena maculata]